MICDNCGEYFIVSDARDAYNDEMLRSYGDGFDYDTLFPMHHLCGMCAVMMSAMEEEGMIMDDSDMPEGCAACGNDSYPMCRGGCSLIDE